jgi:UDP:flavonoid glycosyltransferase YjiC (YdhE family)
MLEDAKSVAQRRLADCWDACTDTDVIVASRNATLVAYHLAEKLRVPLVRAYVAAWPLPPRQIGTGRAGTWLAESLGRAAAAASRQALWQCSHRWVNAARRDVLDLPPLPVREQYASLGRRRVPLLYGFSPEVFTPTERGSWVDVTGYWFDDHPADWEPPPALATFLAAGPPPVFVGFSSATDRNPEATIALVTEALTRAGQRGILQWSLAPRNADLPREVFAIDAIPHDWVFPRVTAAVHHGGSGTTGEALRAGLPSVVVPASFADHPFWGRKVRDLGAGPPPIPRKRLTAERLAHAIHVAATDARIRERALALGERIRSEDGVTRAVEAIERQLAPAAVGVGH